MPKTTLPAKRNCAHIIFQTDHVIEREQSNASPGQKPPRSYSCLPSNAPLLLTERRQTPCVINQSISQSINLFVHKTFQGKNSKCTVRRRIWVQGVIWVAFHDYFLTRPNRKRSGGFWLVRSYILTSGFRDIHSSGTQTFVIDSRH